MDIFILCLLVSLPLMIFTRTRRLGTRIAIIAFVFIILIVVYQAGYFAGRTDQIMKYGAESIFGS